MLTRFGNIVGLLFHWIKRQVFRICLGWLSVIDICVGRLVSYRYLCKSVGQLSLSVWVGWSVIDICIGRLSVIGI